ncbi:SxtJ family membrane protein [Candidatus Magnetominusculus dajiuhuensis]|uniref:SxtJ family membrane protein n=1 Tax=Candidatus Magnetominusculus dajiuhuensis TaxID=3137712 RepID=UPI003B437E71
MTAKVDTQKTINVLVLAAIVGFILFGRGWLLWMAFVLMALNVLAEPVVRPVAAAWMRFAEAVGQVNSKVLLAIAFYLVLTPLSVLYRMFNKELVRHFNARGRETVFDDVKEPYSKKTFERQW